jgi:hypothetical protein
MPRRLKNSLDGPVMGDLGLAGRRDFEHIQPLCIQRAAAGLLPGQFRFQVEERPAGDDIHFVDRHAAGVVAEQPDFGLGQPAAPARLHGLDELLGRDLAISGCEE